MNNEPESHLLHEKLTYKILGLAFEVHRELGPGFPEKVYENALMILFDCEDIRAEQQKQFNVSFKDKVVGRFAIDILVEDKVILELKACECLAPQHKAQTLTYLKGTGLEVALLLNFGKLSLERERFVLTNRFSA